MLVFFSSLLFVSEAIFCPCCFLSNAQFYEYGSLNFANRSSLLSSAFSEADITGCCYWHRIYSVDDGGVNSIQYQHWALRRLWIVCLSWNFFFFFFFLVAFITISCNLNAVQSGELSVESWKLRVSIVTAFAFAICLYFRMMFYNTIDDWSTLCRHFSSISISLSAFFFFISFISSFFNSWFASNKRSFVRFNSIQFNWIL